MAEGQPAVSSPDASGKTRLPAIMRRIRSWVLFLGIISGILGLFGMGIFFIILFLFLFSARPIPGMEEIVLGIPGIVGYVLSGIFSILFTIYLLRYAGRIGRYVAEPRDDLLVDALDVQRICWKLFGIFIIVWFSVMFFSIMLVAVLRIPR
ncbi:MAG: hypothetical protein K6U03_02375 [Firmicutes bacterium]|nr:hypothetical protein [Bacillota bacterium]